MHALVQATSDGLDRDQLSGNNLHSSLVEMTCQCLENLAFSEEIRHSIATPEGINSLMIIVRHSGSVSSRVSPSSNHQSVLWAPDTSVSKGPEIPPEHFGTQCGVPDPGYPMALVSDWQLTRAGGGDFHALPSPPPKGK